MSNDRHNSIFYLFTVIVFCALLIPAAFSEGMFMDGAIYATVGHNLANGIGSFWNLKFSETILNSFHEHPPLVFGIEGLFYRAFGHSYLIEKLYAVLTAILSAFIIHMIWRDIARSSGLDRNHTWIPILFWISTPIVFWSVNNNMLENTMGMFSLSAAYALIAARTKAGAGLSFNVILAALLLIAAFLSKGFPSLYPLALPAILFISLKDYSFRRALGTSLLLIAFIGIFCLLVYTLQPESLESIQRYFNVQVGAALKGDLIRVRRTLILETLIQEILPASALVVIIIYLLKRKGFTIPLTGYRKSVLIMFLLVGLSACLPIMVSPKQLRFYVVPCLPWFMLSLAILVSPFIQVYLERVSLSMPVMKKIKAAAYLCIALIFVLSYFLKGYVRDAQLLRDIKKIGSTIGPNQVIAGDLSLAGEWGMIAYFQRYYFISLDLSGKQSPYLLLPKEAGFPEGYSAVIMETEKLKLAKRE